MYDVVIRGHALDWLSSYLSDHKQCTQYDGTNSDLARINCGVPQGLVLGPLLLIIYITDFKTA